MKNIKRGLFIIVGLLFIFSSFSLGMAVVGIQSVWPTALTTYNRFLAADLGLLPGGKDNKVFSIIKTNSYILYVGCSMAFEFCVSIPDN